MVGNNLPRVFHQVRFSLGLMRGLEGIKTYRGYWDLQPDEESTFFVVALHDMFLYLPPCNHGNKHGTSMGNKAHL